MIKKFDDIIGKHEKLKRFYEEVGIAVLCIIGIGLFGLGIVLLTNPIKVFSETLGVMLIELDDKITENVGEMLTELEDNISEADEIVQTETIYIMFPASGIQSESNFSGELQNYIVYRILNDNGKEPYRVDASKTIIYNTLELNEQEYLEEDYNKYDQCVAIRIYVHKDRNL